MQFENVKVETQVVCSDKIYVPKIDIAWEETERYDEIILMSKITSTFSDTVLDNFEFHCDLSSFNLNNSRVIAGGAEMGAPCQRYDLRLTSFAIGSELYLLFQKALNEYLLIGILSWRIFYGALSYYNGILQIAFPGDGKHLIAREPLSLEEVVFIKGTSGQQVLERFGDLLAQRNNARCKNECWRGWGSWDYYADEFGEKELLDNYNYLKGNKLDQCLLQIDDGYCEWGDWLDVKPDAFPHGIEGVTSRVERDGGIVGLWMAPFLAHKKSKLFTQHPNWFLYDGNGKPVVGWGENYVLDYSLSAVCEWYYNVLKTAKGKWGIKYFKLDFLRCGLKPCRSNMEGVTTVERFNHFFDIVDSALGDDVYVLGCSAVFGPCIGHVNGMRSGPDISPQFSHVKTTAGCSIGNWYFNRKAFQCDPDYLVLRSQENEDDCHCNKTEKRGTLSLVQAKTWADFVAVFGNAFIASDKLSLLDEKKQMILSKALSSKTSLECVPLDLWSGAKNSIPEVLLSHDGDEISLTVFNWDDDSVKKQLIAFRADEKLLEIESNKNVFPHEDAITLELGANASARYIYSGKRSFSELREILSVNEEKHCWGIDNFVGEKYQLSGEVHPIYLDICAKSSIHFDRLTALGLNNGLYAKIAECKDILGIPFDFSCNNAIEINSIDSCSKIEIKIGRKFKKLYILHACHFATKGYFNSYLAHYTEKTEEKRINLCEQIGNSSLEYSLPWKGQDARVAWHDPATDACLYVMEWDLSCPELRLDFLEITSPQQRGNLFILGICGVI